MRRILSAALIAAVSCGAALAEDYAPMAPFAPFVGKTLRGEWADPDGKAVVDLARWELILGGRAIESTHRIVGSSYGGKTIIFWDESAKKYVFHYFTTGGFHTLGEMTLKDGVLQSVEQVEGHPTIKAVQARSTLGPDTLVVNVTYIGKDGSETPTSPRVYAPVDAPGPSFDD